MQNNLVNIGVISNVGKKNLCGGRAAYYQQWSAPICKYLFSPNVRIKFETPVFPWRITH